MSMRKNPQKNTIISIKPSPPSDEFVPFSIRAWFIAHPILARIAPGTKNMTAIILPILPLFRFELESIKVSNKIQVIIFCDYKFKKV